MTAANRPLRVVLAGGGTAGHTSPLIATAHALTALDPAVELTAVGTARGLETSVVPAAGLPLRLISPVPLPRKPTLDLARVPVRLWRSVAEADTILTSVGADVVLGFGGYVSTPVYLAARRRRVPIVIHEQNALPGLANRVAARFTRSVFVSFPGTPLPHAVCIGLPLRREIVDLDRVAERGPARARFGLDLDLPTVLVSGGSQGARSINEAIVAAAGSLTAAGIQLLHVLGPGNLTEATVTRRDPTTGAVYQPLAFVDRMEEAYAAADLMLGRCGASTVLETAAVGLPAIFVPYPHGNGEQGRNAAVVAQAGGGELIADDQVTADWARSRIPQLVLDPGTLRGMSEATASVGSRDAANTLASKTLEVC